MIFEWFLLGSVAFWVLFVLASIVFLICVENDEKAFPAGVAFLAFILILGLAGDLFGYFSANYWRLLYIPGWLAAGLAWTFPRWIILLRRARNKYLELVATFAAEKGIKSTNPADWEHYQRSQFNDDWRLQQWERHYHAHFDEKKGKLEPPKWEDNRERAVAWTLLWPWSMFWTLCRDGIVRLTEQLLSWLGKMHQRLSNWIFKDL